MAKDITEKEYQELVTSKANAIIDLHAEWCGPCKVQGPIIDALSEKYKGSSVKIVKVNVDDEPGVAEALQVRGIPTIVILKEGKVKQFLVGIQREDSLSKIIEELKDGSV